MAESAEKRRPGGRPSVPLKEARQISSRLREFVRTVLQIQTHEALGERTGIDRATITSWHRSKPAMPTMPHLLKLARSTNVSLDWLLLGEGVPLRGVQGELAPSADALLAYLEAELKASSMPVELTRNFLRYWRTYPRLILERLKLWVMDELIAMIRKYQAEMLGRETADIYLEFVALVAATGGEMADDARDVLNMIIEQARTKSSLEQTLAEALSKREALLAATSLFPPGPVSSIDPTAAEAKDIQGVAASMRPRRHENIVSSIKEAYPFTHTSSPTIGSVVGQFEL